MWLGWMRVVECCSILMSVSCHILYVCGLWKIILIDFFNSKQPWIEYKNILLTRADPSTSLREWDWGLDCGKERHHNFKINK